MSSFFLLERVETAHKQNYIKVVLDFEKNY